MAEVVPYNMPLEYQTQYRVQWVLLPQSKRDDIRYRVIADDPQFWAAWNAWTVTSPFPEYTAEYYFWKQ